MTEAHLVCLDADHPGFRDGRYRRRRDAIARLALEHVPGQRPKDVAYTPEETQVWGEVCAALQPLQMRWGCERYQNAWAALDLSTDVVPQLSDVSERLQAVTGFSMEPVAGLVEGHTFLSRLADGVFLSTQYLRHPSRPLYTPEPDWIHEAIGHAVLLVDPAYARLHRLFGEAAASTRDPERIQALDRLYWFTLEFGLVLEGGRPRALGAGLLSSVAELEFGLTQARHVPFDLTRILDTDYDPTRYQETLFVSPSWAGLERELEKSL